MRLIFGAAPTLGSLTIRLATMSNWSHVGIVYGQEVIEAHWPRVRSIGLENFKAHYPRWELAELPCQNEAAAERWVRSRIGNLYDLGGLLAIAFQQRQWQANSRDFCSEMPILSALAGGTRYVREGALHRVTPGQLYDISQ